MFVHILSYETPIFEFNCLSFTVDAFGESFGYTVAVVVSVNSEGFLMLNTGRDA